MPRESILNELLQKIGSNMIRFTKESEQQNIEQAQGVKSIKDDYFGDGLKRNKYYFVGRFLIEDEVLQKKISDYVNALPKDLMELRVWGFHAPYSKAKILARKDTIEDYIAEKLGIEPLYNSVSLFHVEDSRDPSMVKVFINPLALRFYIDKKIKREESPVEIEGVVAADDESDAKKFPYEEIMAVDEIKKEASEVDDLEKRRGIFTENKETKVDDNQTVRSEEAENPKQEILDAFNRLKTTVTQVTQRLDNESHKWFSIGMSKKSQAIQQALQRIENMLPNAKSEDLSSIDYILKLKVNGEQSLYEALNIQRLPIKKECSASLNEVLEAKKKILNMKEGSSEKKEDYDPLSPKTM